VRPDLGATITGEMLSDMPYTRQVRAAQSLQLGSPSRGRAAQDASARLMPHMHRPPRSRVAPPSLHPTARARARGCGRGGRRRARCQNRAAPRPRRAIPPQVVKETLRFRPPAPMVPQVAMRPFKLTESYTAPKGAFIIPDIVSACHQGFSNARQFDPDRFRWLHASGPLGLGPSHRRPRWHSPERRAAGARHGFERPPPGGRARRRREPWREAPVLPGGRGLGSTQGRK
jgi:hypothetical protein